MRWLVVAPGPNFSVADVHAGWVEALTDLGEQVAVYNLDDRLTFYDAALVDTGRKGPDGQQMFRKALSTEQAKGLAANGLLSACYQWWPQIVLVVSAFFIPVGMLDLLRARGHRIVLLHTESPYQDDEQLERAAHADLNLLNDPTNLEAFRAVAPTEYVPHAYRPSVHHPGPSDPDLACDLAFVGTGFESRIAFLEQMDLDGLDVLLAGNWQQLDAGSPLRRYLAHEPDQCLDNPQTAQVYRSARVGLNLYRREANQAGSAIGYAVSPREVEMAACGLFFLRDPRPEGDELFPTLLRFENAEQAGRQLRWWLAHDRERGRAAAKAREAVASRTFTANAKQLLRLLARAPVTR